MNKLLPSLLLACAVLAQAQTAKCHSETGLPDFEIRFDMAGRHLAAPARLSPDKAHKWIVYNKQPFVYKYQIAVAEEMIKEDALAAFLPALVPLIADLKPAAAPAGDQPSPPPVLASDWRKQAKTQLPACEEATLDRMRAALLLVGKLTDSLRQLDSGYKSRVEKYSKVLELYESGSSVLKNPVNACPVLTGAARGLGELKLDGNNDLHQANVEAVALAGVVATAVRDIKDQPCLSSLKPYFDAVEVWASQIAESGMTLHGGRIDKLDEQRTQLKAAQASVAGVLNDPNAFFETGSFGPYDDPHKVTITVDRTDLDGKNKTTLSLTRNVGEPRFSLSAGLATGLLHERTYQRVQSAGANSEVVTRVGRKENTNFRLQPMAFLHARLCDWPSWRAPLYFTTGITAKAAKDQTNIEYLLGGSLGLAGNKVMVTLGTYIGRQEVLQGGLSEGALVPKEISELPVARPLTARFGFAVSYRFK